jgi:hypothetical protein
LSKDLGFPFLDFVFFVALLLLDGFKTITDDSQKEIQDKEYQKENHNQEVSADHVYPCSG